LYDGLKDIRINMYKKNQNRYFQKKN